MRVFLTGATGFIGSHILPELIAAGHQVIGNARSEAGARQLAAAGASVHRGDLNDPAGLARGADGADAVIHTAFDHDFTRFAASCELDRRVVTALGEALLGSDRPLLVTSGVALGAPAPGEPAEERVYNHDDPLPRVATEQAVEALRDRGVSVATVRLSQIHDRMKQGLVTPLVALARQTGRSAYVNDGDNRWCAAAVDDVARLYRLALAAHRPGARWHAVAEEAIPLHAIAEVVGQGLGVPTVSLTGDEAATHFGWLAQFAALDMPATSAVTRAELGWVPTGPSLLDDLAHMDYAVGE